MRLRRRRRWALAFNKLFRRCFLLLLLSASLSVIAYYWDNVERNSNNGKKKTGAQNVFTCSTVCTETPFNLISFLVLRAHPAVCACVSVCSLLQFWPYYLLFISKSPCMRPRVVWHRWSAQVHAHVLRASDVCTGGSDTQLCLCSVSACVCIFTEKKNIVWLIDHWSFVQKFQTHSETTPATTTATRTMKWRQKKNMFYDENICKDKIARCASTITLFTR